MARHAVWPPRRKIHTSGQEYVRFKGKNYYLGTGPGQIVVVCPGFFRQKI